jgi:hypothetical protein
MIKHRVESAGETPGNGIVGGGFVEPGAEDGQNMPVVSLPDILVRTSREITSVLNSLYRSRSFLEQAAVPRLRRTHQNLRQATQASETATHTLLDGLDRALVLIDQLEKPVDPRNPDPTIPDHAAIRFELREEVHRLICSLQFQDIVAQQIGYATRVLEDTERRLATLTEHFDVAVFGRSVAEEEEQDVEDHDATVITNAAIERQAVADSVFGSLHTNQAVGA